MRLNNRPTRSLRALRDPPRLRRLLQPRPDVKYVPLATRKLLCPVTLLRPVTLPRRVRLACLCRVE